ENARGADTDLGQTEQHQDRRRLARPVRAEQTEDLTGAYVEADVTDGLRRSVTLAEAACLDDRFAHRRPNRATAPTMIKSAAPMTPTPATPHTVAVVTATRKLASPVSPRVDAVNDVA